MPAPRVQVSTCPTAPIDNYGLPTRIAPRWYVGYLTFQRGNPKLRTESLFGSGILYPETFGGTFQPVIVPYRTREQSLTGSGDIISNEFSGLNLLQQPSRRNPGGVS